MVKDDTKPGVLKLIIVSDYNLQGISFCSRENLLAWHDMIFAALTCIDSRFEKST